jgi:hypothetical protein
MNEETKMAGGCGNLQMMREGASWKGIKRKRCNEMKL